MRSKNVMLIGMLLFQLMNHRVYGQNIGKSCVYPLNGRGTCINIRSCEPLLNVLNKFGRKSYAFLNKFVCNIDRNNPLVCCPNVGNTNGNNNNNQNNNNNEKNNNNNYPKNNRYGPLHPPECGQQFGKFTRIVDGGPAKLGAWPWIAALGYRIRNSNTLGWLCGGALISARHVLTAAHCVHQRNNLYLVRLGELDLERDDDGATPIDVSIDKRTIHPEYDETVYVNDIAVLRLDRDIEFTRLIQPICLPVTSDIQQKDLNNKYPFVAGWGTAFYNGPRSIILRQLQSPIVPLEMCKAAFETQDVTIDRRVLCTGFIGGGKGTCQGDSGGPLMYPIGSTFYSIGVVSFSVKCAWPGYPDVYSKTQSFLDFIRRLLN